MFDDNYFNLYKILDYVSSEIISPTISNRVQSSYNTNKSKGTPSLTNQRVERKLNIVLDLDNTCICSVPFTQIHLIKPEYQSRFIIHDYITDKYTPEYNYRIFARPFLSTFLKELYKFCNISVWTAAQKDYAEFVVERFFPSEIKLDFFFTNIETMQAYTLYNRIKPLDFVYKLYPQFNSRNTILVDDLEDVYISNIYNVIPIKPFKIISDSGKFNIDTLSDFSLDNTMNIIINSYVSW